MTEVASKQQSESKRKNKVEASLRDLQNETLSQARFINIGETGFPFEAFSREQLHDISKTKERTSVNVAPYKWVIQGLGNETVYFHCLNIEESIVESMFYADLISKKAADIFSMAPGIVAFSEKKQAMVPKGMSSYQPESSSEWTALPSLNTMTVPGEELDPRRDLETHLLLTIIGPAHEIWHLTEVNASLQKKILRAIGDILRRNLGKDNKPGSWKERGAMNFALHYLKICKENNVDLLRDKDTAEVTNFVNKIVHW